MDDPIMADEEYILKIARETILDATLEEIAQKLAKDFVEKHGADIVESVLSKRDELRSRVMILLADKIVDEHISLIRERNYGDEKKKD